MILAILLTVVQLSVADDTDADDDAGDEYVGVGRYAAFYTVGNGQVSFL
jgi:hypothetical protein